MFRSFAFARPSHAAMLRRAVASLIFGLSACGLNGMVSAAPVISSISPVAGTVDGGTIVTVTGTGFVAGSSVTFGGTNAASVSFVSSTKLTAVAPIRAAGKVSLVVRPPSGAVSNSFSGYTYTLPTVSSITPTSGTIDGGTTVTVTGTYFVPGSSVTFNGNGAAVTDISSTQFTVVTPPASAAGVGPMIITTPNGYSSAVSNRFTYMRPAITSISPIQGSIDGGTTVTINGSNFVNGSTVSFGGIDASSVTFISATKLAAVTSTAYGAGLVNVVVTTPAGNTSNAYSGYTYKLPAITTISPTQGPVDGGTTVTINGSFFVNGSSVTFGGAEATNVTWVSASKLTAVTSPAYAAGLSDIVVVTPYGFASNSLTGYTYKLPAITSLIPATGSVDGGTVLTVTGTHFVPGVSVQFNGIDATSTTFVSSTSLQVVAPQGFVGPATLAVVTPLGNISAPFAGFTYQTPSITAITPAQGSMDGGDLVTITGNGFIDGVTVSFGGIDATDVIVNNGNSLTAVTPSSTSNGTVDVWITTPLGYSGASFTGYTYQLPAPRVDAVDPVEGSAAGGTPVTITGSNFRTGATMSIGGVAATAVSVVSSSTITAVTPLHAEGLANITITNSDNQSHTLAGAFNYIGLPPVITSVAPVFGPATGGTTITITGSGFKAGAVVTLGGIAATGINVVSATTITAVTAPYPGGTVDAIVVNPSGAPGRLSLAYSYQMVCTGYTPPTETDPTIVITSPVANAALLGDRVNVTGTYSGPAGTGITVNGSAAITDGYYFYANNIPVEGAMNIDARAVTPYGKIATSSIPVTASGSAPIELKASIDQGTAPLVVTFSYAFLGMPQTIAIDYNGDGVDDFTTSSASAPLTTSYSVPGIYKPRLTITNAASTTYIAGTVIDVKNAAADAAPFQQSYARMQMALLCGDLDGALAHFTEGAKERYRPVFQALAPYMTEILNSWSPLQESEITTQYAEFAVNRLINGVNRIFFIYFLKDQDGVWRLDTM